ncbi:MAG TPA: C40 family peptidase [Flavisolibacter sp.]|nr:C40 family peptidase [Flavisolibacter sp.]
MVKNSIFSVAIVFFLGAFHQASAQKGPKSDIKFINDIEVGFAFPEDNLNIVKEKASKSSMSAAEVRKSYITEADYIERATSLQFKYSILLDTEVETLHNIDLFELIDEWYGTPYRLGGSTKNGIDCSAFMQVMYSGLLGITLPRTSREQYNSVRPVSLTDLKEGDLVFFSTRGGVVSHVGYYLQNNKFVHAGSSTGVTVSDLTDPYWSKHFLRAGRWEKAETPSYAINP